MASHKKHWITTQYAINFYQKSLSGWIPALKTSTGSWGWSDAWLRRLGERGMDLLGRTKYLYVHSLNGFGIIKLILTQSHSITPLSHSFTQSADHHNIHEGYAEQQIGCLWSLLSCLRFVSCGGIQTLPLVTLNTTENCSSYANFQLVQVIAKNNTIQDNCWS